MELHSLEVQAEQRARQEQARSRLALASMPVHTFAYQEKDGSADDDTKQLTYVPDRICLWISKRLDFISRVFFSVFLLFCFSADVQSALMTLQMAVCCGPWLAGRLK